MYYYVILKFREQIKNFFLYYSKKKYPSSKFFEHLIIELEKFKVLVTLVSRQAIQG